jgi:hypothetical protein
MPNHIIFFNKDDLKDMENSEMNWKSSLMSVVAYICYIVLLFLPLYIFGINDYLIIVLYLLFVLIILPIIIGLIYTRRFKDRYYEKCEYNDRQTYAAILISNSLSSTLEPKYTIRVYKNCITYTCLFALYFLELYLIKRKMSYKIIEKTTYGEIREHILNPLCQELFLVGHGSKGRFKATDKILEYHLFKDNNHKKRIVSQLHCGPKEKGKENISLTELLATDRERSFFKGRAISYIDIASYCMWLICK